MTYFFYNLILAVASLFLVPFFALKILFTGKYRKSIGPKLGAIDESLKDIPGKPRIWVHAVSVGEVTAAAPIVAALRQKLPAACLVVSTSTETGQEMAKKIIAGASAFIYFPLDIPCTVRKVLGVVRPEVFAAMETEIWPNFFKLCWESGAKLLILNGRISPRSYKKYMKTRFFWRKILENVSTVGVISETDAERIRDMGMEAQKVQVVGNAKYDSLASRASDPALAVEISKKLGIPPGSLVFVAGSTHPGEESIVLNVYRALLSNFPELLLVLVPRHIERRDEVQSLVSSAGFPDCLKMSDINAGRSRSGERVILVDVIGELFKIYSLASVVYCGGSLVPRGGQNILEAGAWGKTVLFGPHMDDFLEEKSLLENAGAGITVANEKELLETVNNLLKAPEILREKGESGRAAIMKNRGAAQKYVEIIISNLEVKVKG